MQRTWLVVVIVVAGCREDKPAPEQTPPRPERPPLVQLAVDAGIAATDAATATSGIQVFEVDSPMTIVLAGETLMWTDPSGSLWSMPSRGGAKPLELSNQHMPGRPMMSNLVAHGGDVIASLRGGAVRVTPPQGPPVPLALALGDDTLLEMVSDGTAVYATTFDTAKILKIVDGKATTLFTHPRAGLALQGDTLYALSYSKGTLVAGKTGGGALRTIANVCRHPTGFAVDQTSAYVWCESDAALRRVDLKTGKPTVLAKDGLNNSDILVADGDWVYAHTWLGGNDKFLRVAKDGSQVQVLAEQLAAPYDIAVDGEAVFVSVRDSNKILRFDKRSIKPI